MSEPVETEDSRTERYIAAIWRAVAKAMADPRFVSQERKRAVEVAAQVEEQLRLSARLFTRGGDKP